MKVIPEVRHEEALLKAGALQSAIFNSANFSSIATDEKGVIQIFNVGAERMLGYAAADVVNKITPADISDPQELIARARALSVELGTTITPGFDALVFKASRGIEDIYELTYIRKDGSHFPAVVSVTALRDEGDKIIGYLLIGTDNSARKQVEVERQKLDQRVRDQQFYTRSLIESNIDALMTTDPLGIITDVNKQMEALTGCTRDELIGAPFKSHFTDPERAEAAINLALVQKKVTDYELTARTRDGKRTVVSYNASTFYDRDRTLQGVFAAARDVTERKRFEIALQESNIELASTKAAAEKANLMKSDFLAGMSHELRTPLNAILGFSDLLLDRPELEDPERRYLSNIKGAGTHLLELINEVLDISKVEAGKMTLHLEAVALPVLLEPVIASMTSAASAKEVSFTVESAETQVLQVDPTRVRQILYNLLSNAVKFTLAGGTVSLRVAVEGADLLVDVADSGIGIPADKRSRVFGMFERLHEDRSAVTGTGLGLALTKRLVELHGGAITFESEPDQGTTFHVRLPGVRNVLGYPSMSAVTARSSS